MLLPICWVPGLNGTSIMVLVVLRSRRLLYSPTRSMAMSQIMLLFLISFLAEVRNLLSV